jgi:hypothetical protein
MNGQAVAYRPTGQHETGTHARDVIVSGLPTGSTESVLHDDRGRTWFAFLTGFGYLQDGKFVNVAAVPARLVRSIVNDNQANVWVADQDVGLVRVSANGQVDRIPWSALGHPDYATAIVLDRVRGGLWVGFRNGGVAYVEDGKVRASYGPANGMADSLMNGPCLTLRAVFGSRLRAGSADCGMVTSRRSHTNGLPCDAVTGYRGRRRFRVNMGCGRVRIIRDDVVAWASGRARSVTPTVFDTADGVRSQSIPHGYNPQVTKAVDGRLWFVGLDGVNVLDPRRLPFNALAPPVHVEEIVADRHIYDVTSEGDRSVQLPALTRDLPTHYPTRVVAPEKNRFKVKLEGWDRDWQDVGNRRQAFYNNLPPRTYRFRVKASNNSGVWNEAGASLDFAIAPAYYQTRWFDALVVGTCLTLLWAAYQFRVRRIAREFDLRLEERVNERTRVARDLHDTLLQTCHGVLFRFQSATNMLPERPAEAKHTLESAIDRAGAGHHRRPRCDSGSARVYGRHQRSRHRHQHAWRRSRRQWRRQRKRHLVNVAVQGTSRDLHPIVRDEIYRIAGEALRNALPPRARASDRSGDHADDDPAVPVAGAGRWQGHGRAGAGGRPARTLRSVRHARRAELVGGRLDVWSEVGAGTEIDVTIPAAKADAVARARLSWWFAKPIGTDS